MQPRAGICCIGVYPLVVASIESFNHDPESSAGPIEILVNKAAEDGLLIEGAMERNIRFVSGIQPELSNVLEVAMKRDIRSVLGIQPDSSNV